MTRFAHLVLLAATLAGLTAAQDAPEWPDTYIARLQALGLVQTFNAEVLASRSATQTLETWCRDHGLADDPAIKADVVQGVVKPATEEQRQRLRVDASDQVKYRRVRLRCGNRVLSEADNWYVPGRLTKAMNKLLDTTDTPFGRVVQPLEPYRRTFSMKVLWSPLAKGMDRTADGAGALAIPGELLEHRAVVYTREDKPFSEVREVYQKSLLAFRPPR
jgi:chorismate-pyruvate lyase